MTITQTVSQGFKTKKKINSLTNIQSLLTLPILNVSSCNLAKKSSISYKCLSRFDIILMFVMTQTSIDILNGCNQQIVSIIINHAHNLSSNTQVHYLMSNLQKQQAVAMERSVPPKYSIEIETHWDMAPLMNTQMDRLHLTTKNTIIGLDRYDNSCFMHTFIQHDSDHTFKVDILVTNLLLTNNTDRLFNIDNMNTLMEAHSTSELRPIVGCWKGVSLPECHIELDSTSLKQFNNMVSADKQITINKHYLEISRRYPFKLTTTYEPPSFANKFSIVSNSKEYKNFFDSRNESTVVDSCRKSNTKISPNSRDWSRNLTTNRDKYLNFIEIFINDTRILGTISHNTDGWNLN